MKQTLNLLSNVEWEYVYVPENGNRPNEWKKFCRTFKKDVTALLKEFGCTNLVFDNLYFEISVWFTAPNGQMWYLHLSDVRYGICGKGSCYFRTVTSYKDYTGGSNNNTHLQDLQRDLAWRIR